MSNRIFGPCSVRRQLSQVALTFIAEQVQAGARACIHACGGGCLALQGVEIAHLLLVIL